MKTNFSFKGMMVPVFTPFKEDKERTINFDVIDKYAQYLKAAGMQGVMVNGMTGEGMTLTVEERKKLAEKWFEVTKKYELSMLLNIGGIDLASVYELASHAEQLKVDAVMVLPDLFYKPKTEQDLVFYIKDIVKYVPSIPMFYYHIPMMTNVYFNYDHFMRSMQKEVSTFSGIYWADTQIDTVVYLKTQFPEFKYIIGVGTSLMGFMIEGFESFSMTAMNLYPQVVKELYDYVFTLKMQEALAVKEKMTKSIYELVNQEKPTDWLLSMKNQMNKLYPFKVGPVRKPQITTNLW